MQGIRTTVATLGTGCDAGGDALSSRSCRDRRR